MSEVRKEIRERFLSFLFTEIRKGKHMKKKMVAVLLAAGLVISLAACGGASETGNTAETKTENEETAGDELEEEAENTEESTDPEIIHGSILRWMSTARSMYCYLTD